MSKNIEKANSSQSGKRNELEPSIGRVTRQNSKVSQTSLIDV